MEQVVDQQMPVQEPVKTETPDPFSVDEATLSTLAPEARVAFDNATKAWRSKAEEYTKTAAQKAAEEVASKYGDYDEHKKYSEALKQLTGDPQFVQWYQMRTQQQSQAPQIPQVATPDEYALAIQEAAAGNPQRMQMIRMREFQVLAAPALKEFNEMKVERAQDQEIDRLFRAHPDAQELDDTSLFGEGNATPLELAIHRVVDQQRGTFEQAYQVARQIASAYEKKYKDQALGMVNDKKQSVTEKTSQQSKETDNIIEVGSAEEALRKNVEATMRGQKVTYVSKSRLARK